MPSLTRVQKVALLLKSESTLALATIDEKGNARSTPLFFLVNDRLELFWFSSPRSGHSRDLAVNPKASVSVYKPATKWHEIEGVQMCGQAGPVKDRELRRSIIATYCRRFRLGTLFNPVIGSSTLYCFCPDWIRYISNSKRFGYKFEISL